jgi:hypothetical protein
MDEVFPSAADWETWEMVTGGSQEVLSLITQSPGLPVSQSSPNISYAY